MTKQELYEVGLKLLGVYFIIGALTAISLTIATLFKLQFNAHLYKTIVFSLLHPGIQIAFGIILIKKTKLIIGKLENNTANKSSEPT